MSDADHIDALSIKHDEYASILPNFGEHALMKGVQDALKKQLIEQLTRAEEDLNVQFELREKLRKEREDVGVELYGIQQNLARIQSELEGKEEKIMNLRSRRETMEVNLKEFEGRYAVLNIEQTAKKQELDALKLELSKVQSLVRQSEKYDRELASEVALTRRGAAKVEEDTQIKEKQKLDQDLYIDDLQQKVTSTADELVEVENRLAQQRSQIAIAHTALQEATTEMSSIDFERKQLQQRWQSALTSLKRREEALASATALVDSTREKITTAENHVRAALKARTQAEEARERKRTVAETLEAKARALEDSRQASVAEVESLEARVESLAQAAAAARAQRPQLQAQQAAAGRRARAADARAQLIEKKTRETRDATSQILTSATSTEQAGQAVSRDVGKLAARFERAEAAQLAAEHALAAQSVQALELSSAVAQLRVKRDQAQEKLKEAEAQRESAEKDLKAQQTMAMKFAKLLDSQNRRLNLLQKRFAEEQARQGNVAHVRGSGAPDASPAHAELASVLRQVQESRKKIEFTEREWAQAQLELVDRAARADECERAASEARAQVLLMQQQHIRLQSQTDVLEREATTVGARARGLYTSLSRIIAELAKEREKLERMSSAARVQESSMDALRQAWDVESAKLTERIEKVSKEREEALEACVELEAQCREWAKRADLEGDLAEVVAGVSDDGMVQELEQRLQSGRQKLEAIKRTCARLAAEAASCVSRRDVLMVRARAGRQAVLDAAAAVGKGLHAKLERSASAKGLSTDSDESSKTLNRSGSATSLIKSRITGLDASNAETQAGLKHKALQLQESLQQQRQQLASAEAEFEQSMARKDEAAAAAATAESLLQEALRQGEAVFAETSQAKAQLCQAALASVLRHRSLQRLQGLKQHGAPHLGAHRAPEMLQGSKHTLQSLKTMLQELADESADPVVSGALRNLEQYVDVGIVDEVTLP